MVRVVQLSDCHLGPDGDYRLAGIRTRCSFAEVLGKLQSLTPAPDYLLVTGDIAAHGSAAAYDHFFEAMDDCGTAYAWLPGNHDDLGLMLSGPGGGHYFPSQGLGQWRLLSVVTAVPGRVEGRVDDAELARLSRNLDAAEGAPVAIFMHHPPVPVGCAWLDRQRVANSDQLAVLLAGYSNVRAIFAGHVHQAFAGEFAGVPVYTTPSTCFQFAPQQETFALDVLPPGFRVIDFDDTGACRTSVTYLEESGEKVDTRVQGY